MIALVVIIVILVAIIVLQAWNTNRLWNRQLKILERIRALEDLSEEPPKMELHPAPLEFSNVNMEFKLTQLEEK